MRRYLRNDADTRKREKDDCLHFFDTAEFGRKILGLAVRAAQRKLRRGEIFLRRGVFRARHSRLSTDSRQGRLTRPGFPKPQTKQEDSSAEVEQRFHQPDFADHHVMDRPGEDRAIGQAV